MQYAWKSPTTPPYPRSPEAYGAGPVQALHQWRPIPARPTRRAAGRCAAAAGRGAEYRTTITVSTPASSRQPRRLQLQAALSPLQMDGMVSLTMQLAVPASCCLVIPLRRAPGLRGRLHRRGRAAPADVAEADNGVDSTVSTPSECDRFREAAWVACHARDNLFIGIGSRNHSFKLTRVGCQLRRADRQKSLTKTYRRPACAKPGSARYAPDYFAAYLVRSDGYRVEAYCAVR